MRKGSAAKLDKGRYVIACQQDNVNAKIEI
jgi:hypothetical protein